MTIHRRLALFLPMLMLAGGCDPTEPSEQGQWAMRVDLRDHLAGYDQPSYVLIGSQFDLDLVRHRTAGEGEIEVTPELAACVPTSASGSVIASGDEFVVYDVGPGSVEIPAPVDACPDLTGDAASLTADRWSIVGVDAGNVVWSLWFEQVLAGLSPGPAGQFPVELGGTLEGLVRVAAGGIFQLDPVIVDDQDAATPTEIRWSAREAELSTTSDHDFLLQRESEDDVAPTRLFGHVDEATTITTEFRVGLVDNALGLDPLLWLNAPHIEVVPVEQITELELVPVYGPGDGEREWSEPVGVIAVAHDADGNRIVAPPVEWSLTEGRLAVYPPTPSQVSDVITVDDICRERPEQPEARSATIEARLGDLVARTDLEWTALVDGPTPTLDADVCGNPGCDCSTDPSPQGSIAALLGLLGLGLLRRRRG